MKFNLKENLDQLKEDLLENFLNSPHTIAMMEMAIEINQVKDEVKKLERLRLSIKKEDLLAVSSDVADRLDDIDTRQDKLAMRLNAQEKLTKSLNEKVIELENQRVGASNSKLLKKLDSVENSVDELEQKVDAVKELLQELDLTTYEGTLDNLKERVFNLEYKQVNSEF